MGIDFFANERYKVLMCLYERQIEVNGKIYAPLSQEEISQVVGISKATVNNVLKELKKEKYIVQQNRTRGKYTLTDKAMQFINELQIEGDKKWKSQKKI